MLLENVHPTYSLTHSPQCLTGNTEESWSGHSYPKNSRQGRGGGGCRMRCPKQLLTMGKEMCPVPRASMWAQVLGSPSSWKRWPPSFLCPGSSGQLSYYVVQLNQEACHIPFLSRWRHQGERKATVSRNKCKIDFQPSHIISFSPSSANSKISGSEHHVTFANIKSRDCAVSPWGWASLSYGGKNHEHIFRTSF